MIEDKIRLGNEEYMRIFLVAIQIIAEQYNRTYIKKFFKGSFAIHLASIVRGDKLIKGLWESEISDKEKREYINKRLLRLYKKDYIRKKEDYYVLTKKGWNKFGIMTKKYFYAIPRDKEYNFNKHRFNFNKFESQKKRKRKQKFLDDYNEKCGFIIFNGKKNYRFKKNNPFFYTQEYKKYIVDLQETIIKISYLSYLESSCQ